MGCCFCCSLNYFNYGTGGTTDSLQQLPQVMFSYLQSVLPDIVRATVCATLKDMDLFVCEFQPDNHSQHLS